ncbi:ATP-grasp domain-containing protein [Flagellimonas sp.]|uniref:ATP-grasp domain-containing protein n=1 Tax=Flagellimonas sp. TaxID=2058762 RepID=UPI003B5B7DA4
MNILITSAGRRVSLIRSFQKELEKIYPDAKVVAADSDPVLSAACQIADHHFKVPRLDQPDYIGTLIELCHKWNIKLLIPTIDTELLLLAENINLFEKAGIQVVISSYDFVQKCRNKRTIHKFFESHNVGIAKEYPKDNFELPIYIKPIDGSRGVDNHIVKNEESLRDYYFTNEKLMFLEYLDHTLYEEFTCDLYYDRQHSLKCAVPRKRLEVRDGEVYKALTRNNELVSYIKERFGYIEGARGCLTAQFFKHKNEDKIYGIEINPRFGGGYPLTYLSGANYSKWILDEYLLDKKIEDKFNSWEDNLLMIRYDDEILVHGYQC